MLALVVCVVVVVLALVVLGALAYGVAGARARLAREVAAFDGEVRPVLEEFQQAAAARTRERQASEG